MSFDEMCLLVVFHFKAFMLIYFFSLFFQMEATVGFLKENG